jgi:hypothetical protein
VTKRWKESTKALAEAKTLALAQSSLGNDELSIRADYDQKADDYGC